MGTAGTITLPIANITLLRRRMESYKLRILFRVINKVWKNAIERFAITGASESLIDTGMSADTFAQVAKKAQITAVPAKITGYVLSKRKRDKASPLKTLSGNVVKGKKRDVSSARSVAEALTTILYAQGKPVVYFSHNISTWQLKNIIEPNTQAFSMAGQGFINYINDNMKKEIIDSGLFYYLMPDVKQVTY